MNEYIPDNWVMLQIEHEGTTFYKILGGWSGGYLSGNSWRMNSGVVKATLEDDYYLFEGSSGSVYRCHKDSNCVRMNIAGVLKALLDKPTVKLMDIDTNYLELNYE